MVDAKIHGQLRRQLTAAAFLILAVIPATPGQEYQCSNGVISIKSFTPISYPYQGRRAAVETRIRMRLSIDIGGTFKCIPEESIADKNQIGYLFEQEVLKAVSGWKLLNETSKPLNLKLDINFVLSGTVPEYDGNTNVRNLIIFGPDTLTVVVKSTRIVPVIKSGLMPDNI